MTTTTSTSRTRPSLVAAILTLIAALALTGCGTKLTGHITLDDSWAGERVITATVSQQDVTDHLTSGIEAVDAAINKHLPSQLTYSGMSASGEDYVGTFTLTFDSKDDYEKKIKELLAASGSTIEPEIIWEKPDSALVSGVHLEENFSNEDLLAWAADALVVEGLAEEGDKGYIINSSEGPSVTLDGAEYQSEKYSTGLDVDTVQDNGVKSAVINISLRSDDYLATTVYLGFPSSTASPKLDLLDSYLNDHLPEGAEISKDVSESGNSTLFPMSSGRAVSFTASDLETLNSSLTTLLGGSDTFLETSQDGLSVSVKGTPSCANVCSPSADSVRMIVEIPTGWVFDDSQSGDGMSVNHDSQGSARLVASRPFEATATIHLPVTETHVTTTASLTGKSTVEVAFHLPKADVEAAGMTSENVADAIGLAGASAADKDDAVVVTVKASGSPEDVSSQLAEALPGSQFAATQAKGTFSTDYTVTPTIVLPSDTLAVDDSTVFDATFSAPFGQKVSAQPGVDAAYDPLFAEDFGNDSGSNKDAKRSVTVPLVYAMVTSDGQYGVVATAHVSGMALGGWIGLGVLLVVIIALVVLGVVFREKLAALLKSSKQKGMAAAQQARSQAAALNSQASAQAAAQTGAFTGGQVPPAQNAPTVTGSPVPPAPVAGAPVPPVAPTRAMPTAPGTPLASPQDAAGAPPVPPPSAPTGQATTSRTDDEADYL